MMAVILQVDFPSNGPFGAEMATAYRELAASINQEPGLIWKSGPKIVTPSRLAGFTCLIQSIMQNNIYRCTRRVCKVLASTRFTGKFLTLILNCRC